MKKCWKTNLWLTQGLLNCVFPPAQTELLTATLRALKVVIKDLTSKLGPEDNSTEAFFWYTENVFSFKKPSRELIGNFLPKK